MPKIVLRDAHFEFLRKLLWDVVHHEVLLSECDTVLAEELYAVLSYTKYVKAFRVEISPPDDAGPDHAPS
jgi:hypothetical protein